MKSGTLLMFLPDAAIPVLVTLSGVLIVVGLRRLGATLFLTALGMAIAPAFVEPIADLLPGWALLLLMGLMVVGALLRLRRPRTRRGRRW
jgi:hypothetical protein